MIDSLFIVNERTGQSIQINKDGTSPFVLDKIDWDTVDIEHVSYRVPSQFGQTYQTLVAKKKEPVIEGFIISDKQESYAGMKWNDYFSKQKADIWNSQKAMNHMFNIYDSYRLYVDDRYMEVRLTEPVLYSNNDDENNDVVCKFEINLVSYNPVFMTETKQVSLLSVVSMFHFPTPFTDMVFGEDAKIQNVEFVNNGDIDTGCKIYITSNGTELNNIIIRNQRTGQFIQLDNIHLKDGDYIVIDTNIGNESIEFHDVAKEKVYSLIGNMDLASDFFQVGRGSNLFYVDIDRTKVSQIEVYVEFNEKYINVEGM